MTLTWVWVSSAKWVGPSAKPPDDMGVFLPRRAPRYAEVAAPCLDFIPISAFFLRISPMSSEMYEPLQEMGRLDGMPKLDHTGEASEYQPFSMFSSNWSANPFIPRRFSAASA